jgi:drug/metabolite transporter (DMT)-like permease
MRNLIVLNWLVFVALETFAQIALKIAAVDTGAPSSVGDWLRVLAGNGWFQASIAADVANFFAWMLILRRHDLSLAVPLSSLCYVTILLASAVILHEKVMPFQLLGLTLVGIGIALVAERQGRENGATVIPRNVAPGVEAKGPAASRDGGQE